MSDEFQVAEEDMGSFIKHRNAYLDDEIQTDSQLFKVSLEGTAMAMKPIFATL